MSIDGFLKVSDIPGESLRRGHEDEIEVHGVEFDMASPHDSATLARRGRVALGRFTVTKHYDRSSPYLKQALYQNRWLPEVVFSAYRSAAERAEKYLVVRLTNATVVGYDLRPGAQEPHLLEERIAFAYATIRFTYDDAHEVELDVHVGT